MLYLKHYHVKHYHVKLQPSKNHYMFNLFEINWIECRIKYLNEMITTHTMRSCDMNKQAMKAK